jgi:dipeptidyl aminopeptidase/acylaminoacyl peptidase
MFHGVDDEVIPVSESDQMFEALKARGVMVKYERYPDTNHNSWDKAYSTEGLFDWINQQKRSDEN